MTKELANPEHRLPALERQRLAFELRLAGVTYDQIARRLGYASHTGAMKAVITWIKHNRIEPTQELIQIEVARIDRLMLAIWERAVGGELLAIDRVVKLMERRAKLLGLDGAFTVDVELYVRNLAEENGLDPDEALEVARRIIHRIGR